MNKVLCDIPKMIALNFAELPKDGGQRLGFRLGHSLHWPTMSSGDDVCQIFWSPASRQREQQSFLDSSGWPASLQPRFHSQKCHRVWTVRTTFEELQV